MGTELGSQTGSQNLHDNNVSTYILERHIVWCLNNPYIETVPKGQNKFQQHSYIHDPEMIQESWTVRTGRSFRVNLI